MSRIIYVVLLVLCVGLVCDGVPIQVEISMVHGRDRSGGDFVVVGRGDSEVILVSAESGKYECVTESDEPILRNQQNPTTILSFEETEKFMKENGEIIRKCAEGRSRLTRYKRSILKRIFPGTKWCGVGNIAANDSDYGEEIETDKCCQAHDRCKVPNIIKKGQKKPNFKNTLGYNISPCHCDDTFYLCLKDADTVVSDRIGVWFFDNVNMKCYQMESVMTCVSWYIPGVWCKKYALRPGIQVYNGQRWN